MEISDSNSSEVAALLEVAKSGADTQAREDAVDALSELQPVPEAAIDVCIALLDDGDDRLRRSALSALTKARSARALEPLIVALERIPTREYNGHWYFGAELTEALVAVGACGEGDERAIAALTAFLHVEEHLPASSGAYAALASMGPHAKAATAALEERVANGPAWEVAHAHHALYAIDGSVDAHVPALIKLLTSSGDHGSSAAAASIRLGEIGEAALQLVDAAAAGKGARAKKAQAVASSIRSMAKRRAERAAELAAAKG